VKPRALEDFVSDPGGPAVTPGALEEWEFFTRGEVKDEEIGYSSAHETVIVKS